MEMPLMVTGGVRAVATNPASDKAGQENGSGVTSGSAAAAANPQSDVRTSMAVTHPYWPG